MSGVHKASRYAQFVRWVRKTHGWIGLWGAALGLIFGLSGIWLNHRAVLKLPPLAQHRGNVQLALPGDAPRTPDEMAEWLTRVLGRSERPNSVRVEPARPVAWAAVPQMQPARWMFSFGGPNELVQAEYWAGNRSVSVTTTSNGVMATLTNLHKGVGMSVAWILLIDTLAGSMIFLSLSGVILWIQFNRRRAIGTCILLGSVGLTGLLVSVRL